MAKPRPIDRVDTKSHRITYIDGLRGLAVGWVLIHHSWGYHFFYFEMPRQPTLFDRFANVDAQGVSLFLVVSGFCLSYPLLKRRAAGVDDWFRPSVYFARRCLRILPSYYIALVLSILYIALLGSRAGLLRDIGGFPSVPNILAHVFLVHNLTTFSNSINGPFWSLGLEWQWYWVFPVVLLAMVRVPRATLAACFTLAIAWVVSLHPLTGLLTAQGYADVLGRAMLPVRLFEFACGVLTAQLIVDCRIPPRTLLVLALSPIAFVIADPTFYNYHRWVEQPIFGISFGALLLLGHSTRFANRLLSWPPLVSLGVISYSVYLVHLPVVESIDRFAPLPFRRSPAVMAVAGLAGLTAGAVFHFLVERPCMQPTAWQRVSPILVPAFSWTDRVISRWLRPGEPPHDLLPHGGDAPLPVNQLSTDVAARTSMQPSNTGS